jgi:hypothetical protein
MTSLILPDRFQRGARGSKYNNIITEYKGFKYDSMAEAKYAWELDMRLRAREFQSWEPHGKLKLEVNGFWICDYEIDFIVYHHDGTIEYVEVKGAIEPLWQAKWNLLEALTHNKPHIKRTLVPAKNIR